MRIVTTWTNNNPDTIWHKLARRLGREPTDAEAADEVRRVLTQATIDAAQAGRLPHQRKRGA